jgi:diguanylate cyclase (GGDEF)-like protein/PAS domain S-box-containing protein
MTKKIFEWELNLARRLAMISIAGGFASWLFRVLRQGFIPDFLGIFLSAFILCLAALLFMRVGYRVLAATLITGMMIIGLQVSWGLIEPRSGPMLVLIAGVALSAAYYRFRIAFLVILASAAALSLMGYSAADRLPGQPVFLPNGLTVFTNFISASIGYVSVGTLIAAVISYVVTKMEQSLRHTRILLITARNQKGELEAKERLLTLFTELASDYVYQVDLRQPNMVPQVFAGSFERITGYAPADIGHMGGWITIVHPDDRENLQRHMPSLLDGQETITEYRILTAAGKTVWVRDHVRPVRDAETGTVTMLLGAVHDVTERRAAEEQIENLAFYDPLTSLPNRRLLLDRLEQALAISARTALRGALLFIDLDHFKNLNDTKGHEAGDQLLVQQSRRLKLCIREGDTVARLGGDEFIIILSELSADEEKAAEEVTEVTRRILQALSLPVALSYRQMSDYENTCSIGVTMFKGHELTVDELLRRADMAMYQAKADGRNAFRFFDPQMQQLLAERLKLEDDLKQALLQSQFVIYLQSQLGDTANLVGAEVLLRWLHPEKGIVSPLDFIPSAERTGLIVEIGAWVIDQSCAILARWAKSPATAHLSLAVNVSARQFHRADFAAEVGKALARHKIDGTRLKLELTESLALENVADSTARMQELRSMGIQLSLDDFGTGQSSLYYLKQLPLSQIKIDQSFVRDISTDPNDAVLVKTIIGMAENLRLEVIAEGVETEAQLSFLRENGCHLYQGYLFSRPISVAEFEMRYLQQAHDTPQVR